VVGPPGTLALVGRRPRKFIFTGLLRRSSATIGEGSGLAFCMQYRQFYNFGTSVQALKFN
jgi:hypothetical protein